MRIAVTKQVEGWTAGIQLRGEHGSTRQRGLTIDRDRCQELSNAIVLVSALLLDDLWAEERVRAQESSVRSEPTVLVVPNARPVGPRPRSWAYDRGVLQVFA